MSNVKANTLVCLVMILAYAQAACDFYTSALGASKVI
jgi:hypothetical protein